MDLRRTPNRNTHLLAKARSMSFDYAGAADAIPAAAANDDAVSNNSTSSSSNLLLAAVSDTECQSPVSVRDMIKRWDSVAKLSKKGSKLQQQQQQNNKQKPPFEQQQTQHAKHNLPAMKSAYFGMNKFGTSNSTAYSRFPLRQYVSRVQEKVTEVKAEKKMAAKSETALDSDSIADHHHTKGAIHHSDHSMSDKNASNCLFVNTSPPQKRTEAGVDGGCIRRGRHVVACSLSDSENVYMRADYTRRTSRSPVRDLSDVTTTNNSCEEEAISTTELNASIATEGVVEEEINSQPMQASYQSKTTIAKTAAGVRIIIDIFFDPKQQPICATDVLGSRVETDIPESRILNEFQQQTADAVQLSSQN